MNQNQKKIDGRWKEKEREQTEKRRGGRLRWATPGQRMAELEVAGGGARLFGLLARVEGRWVKWEEEENGGRQNEP